MCDFYCFSLALLFHPELLNTRNPGCVGHFIHYIVLSLQTKLYQNGYLRSLGFHHPRPASCCLQPPGFISWRSWCRHRQFILSLNPQDYLVTEITCQWVDSESKPNPELQRHYQASPILGSATRHSRNGTIFYVRRRGPLCSLQFKFKVDSSSIWKNHVSFQLKFVSYFFPLILQIAFKSKGEGGGWVYVYFIDFDKHILVGTWTCDGLEAPLDNISLEELVKDGVEGYLERVVKPQEEDEEVWKGWRDPDESRRTPTPEQKSEWSSFSNLLVCILVLCFMKVTIQYIQLWYQRYEQSWS